MLDTIKESWAWHDVDPVEIVSTNEFGNVIVRSTGGDYWRICPEELSCDLIASTEEEFEVLQKDPEFRQSWEMDLLVEKAFMTLGLTTPDRCYCLKIPAVLGGAYDESNFGTISRQELISSAGDLAQKIKDLPDGSKVRLVIKERS